MGNKTVTPEKSRAPINHITSSYPRASVTNFNSDVPSAPTKPPTPPISFNSPTFSFPIDFSTENFNNIHPIPTTSPTFVFPVHSPTTAIPIESPIAPDPIEHSRVAITVNSPTSEIPIVSSTKEVPLNSPTPRIFVISPIPRTPRFSPSTAISAKSPTARIPVPSPIPVISTTSPSTIASANSPNSKIPVPSPIIAVPVNSPIAAPVASSSPDIPIPSPISNINGFPVLSPDTSAVSPTLDFFTTPIVSPIPPKAVSPVKPTSFSSKNRSVAHITHDASTSPMVRVVSNAYVIPTSSRPTEVARRRTILKNALPPPVSTVKHTKPSTLSSADRSSKWNQFEQKKQEKQSKFVDPPQQERERKFADPPQQERERKFADPPQQERERKFADPPQQERERKFADPPQQERERKFADPPQQERERKFADPPQQERERKFADPPQQERERKFADPPQQERERKFAVPPQQENKNKFADPFELARSWSTSEVSSPSISDADLKITPVIPNIIAVPSFSLRSTAVCNLPQDPQILSERTQSIHTDLSIFKYYLTYNEAKHSIGDHTKATMFKMDTRLKQTPLPAPCLSFLKKNFSDGSHETKHNPGIIAPSFGSLGLQHDLENELNDKFPTEPRLHEKQQRRKLRQFSVFPDDASDSNNSLQFVTSTFLSQADFLAVDQTSIENNRQPLTSILKKPSTQLHMTSFSTKTNNPMFQEIQKNDFENNNNASTISFKIPASSLRTKASQSISRSERLIHRKK